MHESHPRLRRDDPGEHAPPAHLLRIGSYNIHRCVGSDFRRDTARVARVIRELRCDTVALQEVDSLHAIGEYAPQLEYLASATGMQAIPAWTMQRRSWHYGNALLTTREVRGVERHDISWSRFEPRSVLRVELVVAGQPAHVFLTHLGLFSIERHAQVRRLRDLMRAVPREETLVLLGDMNEWLPNRLLLRWLHEDLGTSPAAPTFPVWLPLLALDRMWVRPAHSLTGFEVHRSPAARSASDHYPIRGIVEIGAHV